MTVPNSLNKILIIQTAFIGDVILSTALLENLHKQFPNSELHLLVRKGNESIFDEHPYLHKIWIWDKKNSKYKSLFKIWCKIRNEKFDLLINLQRFASSGLISAFSNAKEIRGFKKNPFSFFFSKSLHHEIGNKKHEIDRNYSLIQDLVSSESLKPKLYPSEKHFDKIKNYTQQPFVILAPGSVWKTKQLPIHKWIELCQKISNELTIYLIGAKTDYTICEHIKTESKRKNIHILAGELSLLESAALISKSKMNYVNDSAPLHLASATNAPVTAFFCSTLPEFGFGPLSDLSLIAETKLNLPCRPCGLHGKMKCPEKHFNCGNSIDITNFAI